MRRETRRAAAAAQVHIFRVNPHGTQQASDAGDGTRRLPARRDVLSSHAPRAAVLSQKHNRERRLVAQDGWRAVLINQAEFAAAAVLRDKATLAVLRGQRNGQRQASVQVRGSQRAHMVIRWLVQEGWGWGLKRGSVQAPGRRRPQAPFGSIMTGRLRLETLLCVQGHESFRRGDVGGTAVCVCGR